MTARLPRARARIDLAALRSNYARVRALYPQAGLVPVVKANAYGHGMAPVARALAGAKPAALAVATLDEALALAGLGLGAPVVLLGGYIDEEELAACLHAGIEPVIHGGHQLAAMEAWLADGGAPPKRLWVKANTGMNRLGMGAEEVAASFARLGRRAGIRLVLMSHLANADEGLESPGAQRQLARFAALRERLRKEGNGPVETSLSASAAILAPAAAPVPGQSSLAASATIPAPPDCRYVRPGIMLYGGSPLAGKTGADLGLQPVMTLTARLMAVNQVAAGEAVGYGGAHVCAEPTRVGVVSCGYGDGYPRAAPTGTPLLVKAGGKARPARLLGRVSMDMLTIDLNGLPEAQVGDEVILWGAGLSADTVAAAAGTISYELFCQVTPRVPREDTG